MTVANGIIEFFASEKNRGYIYRVLAAGLGLLIAHGLIATDVDPAEIVSFLGTLLAVKNTSIRNGDA